MSVKSFKFVSPGVFINEIDNSFIPKSAGAIGPVVIGRATRGLAMTPVKVESYSQFVEMFGDTVPGNAGGDISRYGNFQSPMYGTYAAKAFLNANVAPLTFIRLLGQQDSSATSGYAGWKTANSYGSSSLPKNADSLGGTFGMWVWPTPSVTRNLNTAILAAVWNVEKSGSIMLSGSTYYSSTQKQAGIGKVIKNDSTSKEFTVILSSSLYGNEKFSFNFDDSSENFIRKVFNTNPQLTSEAGAFYPSTSARNYWLGETYEQALRNGPPAAAVGSVTLGACGVAAGVNDPTGHYTASTVVITDHAGSSKTYVFVSGSSTDSTAIGEGPSTTSTALGGTTKLSATGSADVLAARLSAGINSATGHNGSITAVARAGGIVDLFQAETGEKGNTTITRTQDKAAPATTVAGFTGGRVAYVAGGSTLVGANANAVILPIASGSTAPSSLEGQTSREAVAGWFVGQDLKSATTYSPEGAQKLFRLIGRGHGEWLHKNVKVSIEKIRQSSTSTTDYGTFSLVLRALGDTDSKVQVLERYDGCTLDPSSPNFVARKLGNKYTSWDATNRRLKTYGEYDNQSKFVYVDMDTTVEDGGTDPLLLPFGYFGPPKFKDLAASTGAQTNGVPDIDAKSFIRGSDGLFSGSSETAYLSAAQVLGGASKSFISGCSTGAGAALTGGLAFPIARLRHSASDGGLADPTNAYFGLTNTRDASSTRNDPSIADFHNLLYSSFPNDPVGSNIKGVDSFAYVFTLDDVAQNGSDSGYYYASGSRKSGYSVSGKSGQNYKTLVDAGYNRFTAPFWGGFDGFDVHKPDPLYNKGIAGTGGSGTGTATEKNSYQFFTYKQAIDTVADPEAIDMNLLLIPGLTQDALTNHMINVCEERADALSLIDLSNVYVPAHEQYNSDKSARIATTPTQAANNLRDRRIDSSYGATFYPWVQTRDEFTGQLLWIPPSVAMAGVLASSQASSDVWFAPAGFNRGGLSDGAAGIPVTGITERLVSKDRDTLYESRINPIASFPSSGIVVFGQKTLQERQSALDRINVRRLVIFLKKQISILATQILFEQNVSATWNRFVSLIEPFLANVKVQFGITDYKLILDESTTTPDLIDQNILYAKIMVKPARAIEYIAIDFVIASTGASFDD